MNPNASFFHAIAAGGEAVGRGEDGRVVFAAYAAPGDVAQVALVEEHRSFGRGRVLELETSSPQRIAHPARFINLMATIRRRRAAAASVQHLAYEAQLDAKRAIVRDALRRIGGIEDDVVALCVPSPQPFGYRNKADFKIEQRGPGRIGFFARGSITSLT